MDITRIACIGSREISGKTEKLMESIGEFIIQQGWYVSSGNAIGSDAAYARGANRIDPTHVILYLPKPNVNKELIVEGNRVSTKQPQEWVDVARNHHDRFDKLDPYVQKLMARNAGIVLRATKVIAYLNPNKPWGGGTGHGWRIAKTYNIPRLDLSEKEYTLQEVSEWLSK